MSLKIRVNSVVLNLIKPKNLYINLALIVLFVTLTPYLLLAFFSVPASDDFLHASLSLDLGVLGFIKHRYLSWSGRYSSDFVISIYNVIGHKFSQYFLIKFFWIIPLFIISLYLGSNYIFISLLTSSNKFKFKLLFSLISLIAILTNTELNSTVFWLAGGATYGLGNSLFMISFGITIYTLYINQKNLFLCLINLLLILFINGLSETMMVSYTTLIITILLLNIFIFTNSLTRNLLLNNIAYLAVALISAFIVYLAPGNQVRTSQESSYYAGKIILCISRGFWSTFENVFYWINPFWFCLVILLVFSITKVFTTQIETLWINRKTFLIIITSLIAALYMSYYTRWYALGWKGPPRSNSTSYTIFLMITIILSLYIVKKLNSASLANYIKTGKTFISIIIIFCCLSVAVNYQILKHDLRILKRHYEYYQTIYPLVIQARSNDDIKLPSEPRVKILRYRHNYLTINKQNWINTSFSRYFNLNSVVSNQTSSK